MGPVLLDLFMDWNAQVIFIVLGKVLSQAEWFPLRRLVQNYAGSALASHFSGYSWNMPDLRRPKSYCAQSTAIAKQHWLGSLISGTTDSGQHGGAERITILKLLSDGVLTASPYLWSFAGFEVMPCVDSQQGSP